MKKSFDFGVDAGPGNINWIFTIVW